MPKSGSLNCVIQLIQQQGFNKREAGDVFEELVAHFFRTHPNHQDVKKVQSWQQYEGRKTRRNKGDLGVDLVAYNHKNEKIAIQCKYRSQPNSKLAKKDIDSFLNELGKKEFQRGIVASTCYELSSGARQAFSNRNKHCQYVGFTDLDPWLDQHLGSQGINDIQATLKVQKKLTPLQLRKMLGLQNKGFKKPSQNTAKKQLKDHQQKALKAVAAKFKKHPRGKLIMPCGTGKTFTALKIAEHLVPSQGLCIVLMPSLSLVSQTYREFKQNAHRKLNTLIVCSDKKAGPSVDDISLDDLSLTCQQPTTNAHALAERLHGLHPFLTRDADFAPPISSTRGRKGRRPRDESFCQQSSKLRGLRPSSSRGLRPLTSRVDDRGGAKPSARGEKPTSATKQQESKNEQELTVIFSTYHSIEVIAEAQKILNKTAPHAGVIDLIICDEAHRTTGVESPHSDKKSYWNLVHDDNKIKASKRLYMTATPRVYTDGAKNKADKNNYQVFCMDDENTYGPIFYQLKFSEAISEGLLSDYKIVVLGIDEKFMPAFIQQNFTQDGEIKADDAAKVLGCYHALSKNFLNSRSSTFAGQKYTATLAGEGYKDIKNKKPMQRAVAFSSTIKESLWLQEQFNKIVIPLLQKNSHPSADSLKNSKTNKAKASKQATPLRCEVQHVDGGMNSHQRDKHLNWLKQDLSSKHGHECRILSNARCLSEGVDVPSLDAVMFLKPRKSKTDIVQAVGRVMRKPVTGKKEFGYIILPIITPSGIKSHKALDDNARYQVIWDVVQALRSHDDRLENKIDQLPYSQQLPSSIVTAVIGQPDKNEDLQQQGDELVQQAQLAAMDWQQAIVSKLVLKCGDRAYLDKLGKDIHAKYKTAYDQLHKRIQASADGAGGSKYTRAIDRFVGDLQRTINPTVDRARAIEMLAMHSVTKPLFEALFGGSGSFSQHNPVSQAMAKVLRLFNKQSQAETQNLKKSYQSITKRVKDISSSQGRQKLISDLYEQVFKQAFPKLQELHGMVYTPVEVVDFMLHSVNHILKQEFGKSLQSEGVKILDPFSGTGTFLTRLIENKELIDDKCLQHKYQNEMWACEIMLLAYYISTVNIEQAYYNRIKTANPNNVQKINATRGHGQKIYKDITRKTEKLDSAQQIHHANSASSNTCLFKGAIFADTFQTTEGLAMAASTTGLNLNKTRSNKSQKSESSIQQSDVLNLHKKQTERLSAKAQAPHHNVLDINEYRKQKMTHDDIRVIIGNPPYSKGQKSANDNNKNMKYPDLDIRVKQTYSQDSKASAKNSSHDSYVRALRWATDKLYQHHINYFNPNLCPHTTSAATVHNKATKTTQESHIAKQQGITNNQQATGRSYNSSGIVAFITNASFIDSQSLDGLRDHLAHDFTSLYIFNLRGDQRTKGKRSRQEGGKIFGQGCRAPIAISFLVKNPNASDPLKDPHNLQQNTHLQAAESNSIADKATQSVNQPHNLQQNTHLQATESNSVTDKAAQSVNQIHNLQQNTHLQATESNSVADKATQSVNQPHNLQQNTHLQATESNSVADKATKSVNQPATKSQNQPARIYYCDIGDYLNRDQKLKILNDLKDISNISLRSIWSNEQRATSNEQRATSNEQQYPSPQGLVKPQFKPRRSAQIYSLAN